MLDLKITPPPLKIADNHYLLGNPPHPHVILKPIYTVGSHLFQQCNRWRCLHHNIVHILVSTKLN